MLATIVCLTAMALLPAAVRPSRIFDITFQRVEQTKGFDILKSNVRVTKFNRTTAVINGTVDLFIDLDNSYTLQVKAAYSRLGNNQFNEYPLKLAERPFCHFMNNSYRDYQDLFKDTTNVPQIGPEGLCPMFAGRYWYKKFTFDQKYLPRVIPPGYWRMTGLIIGPQGTVAVHVYVSVAMKLF